MMRISLYLSLALSITCSANGQTLDVAAAFGAREAVEQISLSPDGTKLAFLAPTTGQGSRIQVIDLAKGDQVTTALAASGDPERLGRCLWISTQRLACSVYGTIYDGLRTNYFNRIFAVNADGSGAKLLSTKQSQTANYISLAGGNIIDYLPNKDDRVLMARTYVPEGKIGSLIEKTEEGLGVDEVDSQTLHSTRVVKAVRNAVAFLSDGKGTVRIMGTADLRADYQTGITHFLYRLPGETNWQPLSDYDATSETGFLPAVVDAVDNSVLGFEKLNGRKAVYRVKLDGSDQKTLVFAHDEVDADGIVRIGRAQRPVGVTYAVNMRSVRYFDAGLEALRTRLTKALPGQALWVVDASLDEKKLLLWASADTNPGKYYLLDRTTNQLRPLLASRPELQDKTLAEVKPISLTAADGTKIPAYLTLPAGSTGRNLPAIVMPHGGPSARDEWGFDWLPQFFAARGYAVLQPNYRGSDGYGDAWYQNNGFKSWAVAIGDIVDSGRWLVSQGIADPKRLGIVGWSYGGYAALQSDVTAPGLFKAVVAIAPVTDLALYRSGFSGYSNETIARDFIGSGPHIKLGSPAQRVQEITAPVMLVHGEKDVNVDVEHSRLMAKRLREAGRSADYWEVPKLDHYLEDSLVRRDLLARSDAFLKRSFGP